MMARLLPTLLAAAASGLTGCAYEHVTQASPPPPAPIYGGGHYGAHSIIVYDGAQTPPPRPEEIRPQAPKGYKSVWVPGHWHRQGRQYVWVKGHYNRA